MKREGEKGKEREKSGREKIDEGRVKVSEGTFSMINWKNIGVVSMV